MSEAKETYDQMVERIAYRLMQGIAKGEGAIYLAGVAANTALLWRRDQDTKESKNV